MEVFEDDDIQVLEAQNQFELLASRLANQYGLHIKIWVGQSRIEELKKSKYRKGICRAIVDH